MFDAQIYLEQLISALESAFGSRLVYVGLQGSYLRGEATEQSDIDPMVVIDQLTPADLQTYRSIVETLEKPELSCGFLCGKQDLKHWNALEIAQLVHGTQDHFGCLNDLVPAWTQDDLRAYVKLSLGNLYHELVHRRVHASMAKNRASLPITAKGVFFILQGVCLLEQGVFYQTKKELMAHLTEEDRKAMELPEDFDEAFEALFAWCQNRMASLTAGH